MSRSTGQTDWVLPEQVSLANVTALFQQCAANPAAIGSIDLSRVSHMDSAGVALLHWLRDRQTALGLTPAPLHGHGTERYRALCQAHRLNDPGNTPA